ncbi:MAG: DUF4358 domain-containing protein [Oscillospiraceae bacterium]|nr:DUF4358 domain-containing protein [Oscillospiraceae bacterium]
MLKKTFNRAVPALLLVLCIFACASCQAKESEAANQSLSPHEAALSAVEKLGYTYEQTELGNYRFLAADSEWELEYYYSEGSGDELLDDILFDVILNSGDELTLSMVEQYSIFMFDKDAPIPFELVILKLPKTDGKVDSGLVEKAKNAFKAHIEQYKKSLQDYLPQFVPYAENLEIKATDNFVYYCMAENSSAAMTAIHDFLVAD